MKAQYNVKTSTNKALLICTVIASAFPVLESVIQNFDNNEEFINSDGNISIFVKALKESMTNNTDIEYTSDIIADMFTTMYFLKLNWPRSENNIYSWVSNPATYIYNAMKRGIDYIFNNYNKLIQDLARHEDEPIADSGLIWPIPGVTTITTNFGRVYDSDLGRYRTHNGIDIAGNCYGKPVIASADGKVIQIYNSYAPNETGSNFGYGNYVMLSHDNKIVTMYAHLLDTTVKLGDTVKQGQVVGHCDNTGWSTGPHLHYEIRVDGTFVDPLIYVSPNT